MVNNKKNKMRANGKAIQAFRTALGLTQDEFVAAAKKKYLKLNKRNLQSAEASNEIGVDTLNGIAYLIDKENFSSAIKKRVSINDIAFDPNIKSFNELGLEDTKNIPAFREYLKKNRTFRTERTYLTRVDNHDQVFQIIKNSKKRKIFYPFNPDQNEVLTIKRCLTEISRMRDAMKGPFDFDVKDDVVGANNFDTDEYHEVEKEIQSLTKISDFTETIKELKKQKVNLYVGSFDFKYIDTYPTDPWEVKEVEEADGSYSMKGKYKPVIKSDNYAIFSFHKSGDTAVTFNYDNEWFEEKIQKIIETDPVEEDEVDYIAHQRILMHYEHQYNYINKFSKMKTNLTKTDLTELLTPDEIEKIGYQYEMDKAEDQYAQMQIDEMRGK
ncbi:hypothetical protein OA950_00870 [Candidatus Pelagibacter sp.]|nr:hypothetical protein [Candidatus Pelagibacter sp.]